MADYVWVLMLKSGSTCTPFCVLSVRTSRAGSPACLPPSMLANASSLPPSDLIWGSHSCHCLLGYAAINGLQVLFWSFSHWWLYLLFHSFVRSTICLRAHALKSGVYTTWTPTEQLRYLHVPHAGTSPECVCQDNPSRASLLSLTRLVIIQHSNLCSWRFPFCLFRPQSCVSAWVQWLPQLAGPQIPRGNDTCAAPKYL